MQTKKPRNYIPNTKEGKLPKNGVNTEKTIEKLLEIRKIKFKYCKKNQNP